METNIVSKSLSKLYTHPTRAMEHAQAYADKMREKGYRVDVRPNNYSPQAVRVDVMRKR